MVKVALLILASLLCLTATRAGDIDYDKVDYSKYARPERLTLAKCFKDMLAVVERHKLRSELWDFLEAGCQSEIRSVEFAIAKDPPPGFQGLSEESAAGLARDGYIAPMEEQAEKLYKKQDTSFCNGNTCVLDEYRKCMMLQASQEIERRTKPAKFEDVLKSNCRLSEVTARATLTNDFLAAQRLQQSPELSDKTRDLIDGILKDLRQAAVVSYAEDLVKVQPGRKSCKIPVEMCGQDPCISLDEEPEAQQEYECAIQP